MAIARRLQIQERLTAEVAECIWNHLKPHGVAVVIEASHACMTARGVRTPGVSMVTSRMMGTFREDERVAERGAVADGLLIRPVSVRGQYLAHAGEGTGQWIVHAHQRETAGDRQAAMAMHHRDQ